MNRKKGAKNLANTLEACLDVTPYVANTTAELMGKIFDYPNDPNTKITLIENNKKTTLDLTPYNFIFDQICQIHSRMIGTCHNAEVKKIDKAKEDLYIDYSITDKNYGYDIFYANLTLCLKSGNMLIYKTENSPQNKVSEITTLTIKNIDDQWVVKKETIKENALGIPTYTKTKKL